MDMQSGGFQWKTAPSSTANSVITLSELMRLNANGNLLLNTTTDAGFKLDVNGTGRFSGAVAIRNDQGTSIDAQLRLRGTNATARTTRIQLEDYAGLYADAFIDFKIPTAGVASSATLSIGINGPNLTFVSTGAATFSSSVQSNTNFISNITTDTPSVGTTAANNATYNYLGYSGYWGIRTTTTGFNFALDTFNAGTSKNVLTITQGGNVGIGTTSPSNTLQIGSTSYTGNEFAIGNGSTNFAIDLVASGQTDIYNSGTLTFSTALSERMRITSGGALCLGVTSAYGTNLLNVNGGIYATSSVAAVVAADLDMMVFQNTGATYSKACLVASMTATGGTGSYFFYGQQSTSTAAIKIFSNGNIQNTNNSYGAISDARLKENIKDATPKLDDLMKVKVRNYNLKGESNKQLGVISQELEAIFPNMIEESTNMGENMKIKGVKYSVFVPMLIKAVQELKAEIEILKNK
jgi:hypothetical protein